MDRKVLKQNLHEQVVPMAEAVQKKLAYLNSDDVFMNKEETSENFTDLLMAQNKAMVAQKRTEPTNTADKVAMHKQNLAAKIAALRGISNMPGDYLNRKF